MSLLTGSTWIIRGILVLCVAAGTWWLQARISRSYEADELQKQLEMSRAMASVERAKNAEITAARQRLEVMLAQKEQLSQTSIKAAIKDALRHIPKSSDCDYDTDLTSVLNRARGYNPEGVPGSTDNAATEGPKTP